MELRGNYRVGAPQQHSRKTENIHKILTAIYDARLELLWRTVEWSKDLPIILQLLLAYAAEPMVLHKACS